MNNNNIKKVSLGQFQSIINKDFAIKYRKSALNIIQIVSALSTLIDFSIIKDVKNLIIRKGIDLVTDILNGVNVKESTRIHTFVENFPHFEIKSD